MACYSRLRGWRGWRACVGGVLVWVAWMTCLRGWRACVGGVLGWVAYLRGLRASVGGVPECAQVLILVIGN